MESGKEAIDDATGGPRRRSRDEDGERQTRGRIACRYGLVKRFAGNGGNSALNGSGGGMNGAARRKAKGRSAMGRSSGNVEE